MLIMMRTLLLVMFLLATVPAHALPAGAEGAEPPRYLNTKLVPPDILAAPSKEGSAEWKKQVAQVVQAQRRVTKQDKLAIDKEQKVSVQMVSNVLGDKFTPEQYPKTFVVLKHVFNDTGIVVETARQFWKNLRPYAAASKQVKVIGEEVDGSSYPSGHTALANILAEVLGILMPQQRAALRAQVDSIAQHRIQSGAHYPEDIQAGEKLGTILLGAMLQDEDFQSDMKAAKEEIAAHAK